MIELNNLDSGKLLTVHLTGTGTGALIFKGGQKAATAYFRDRSNGGDKLIKIGKISKLNSKNKNVETDSLKSIIQEANRLYSLSGTVGNLQAHLEDEKIKAQLESERRKTELSEIVQKKKIEEARGSLTDLFQNYIDGSGIDEGSRKELSRILAKDLIEACPEIAIKKARDVTPDDIVKILGKISARNAPAMADKVRSYLSAAYGFELKNRYAYSVKKSADAKRFEVDSNPVQLISKEHTGNPRTRALNDLELKQFYNTVAKTEGVSERMGLLFQLNIQLGGQRILQLSRAPWADYDFIGKTVKLIDPKGKPKNGVKAKRVHIVPLTTSAIKLIHRLQKVSEGFDFPFSVNGIKPFGVTSFSHAIATWLASKNAVLNDKRIEKFDARDLRRTCTQLLMRIGVRPEDNNVLQSHGISGVVHEHYLNEPMLYVPQKAKALKALEKKLKTILSEKPANEN